MSTNAEGIFMASGENHTPITTCRFGRTEANAGSDVCQECSRSSGLQSSHRPGEESARKEDFTGCIDGLPIKED